MFKALVAAVKNTLGLGPSKVPAPVELLPLPTPLNPPRPARVYYPGVAEDIITKDAYLAGRDKTSPLTFEMRGNMLLLLDRVNRLLVRYQAANPNAPRKVPVNSGYRPEDVNNLVNGAPHSPHLFCQAIDLGDVGEHLDTWITANDEILVECELNREHPLCTPGWVHLDIRSRGVYTFWPDARPIPPGTIIK